MNNTVKVISPQTDDILFECPIEEAEKAYQYASDMDKMGIDVKVIAPSLPETLANSLGMPQEDVAKLKEAINDEIASHLPDGCAICETPLDSDKLQ